MADDRRAEAMRAALAAVWPQGAQQVTINGPVTIIVGDVVSGAAPAGQDEPAHLARRRALLASVPPARR